MKEKILKTVGFCTDGCQWSFCSFLYTYTHDEKVKSHCRLFGDAEIWGGKSLHICNKNYGSTYDGEV